MDVGQKNRNRRTVVNPVPIINVAVKITGIITLRILHLFFTTNLTGVECLAVRKLFQNCRYYDGQCFQKQGDNTVVYFTLRS